MSLLSTYMKTSFPLEHELLFAHQKILIFFLLDANPIPFLSPIELGVGPVPK